MNTSELDHDGIQSTLDAFAWSLRETPIRYFGDPALRVVCSPVEAAEFSTPEIDSLASELKRVLVLYRQANGVGRGLAANQIGGDKRMIVVLLHTEMDIMCNPRLIKSEGMGSYWEACLSSGSLLIGEVHRVWRGIFEYEDLRGKTHRLEADEKQTRVILHEIDHLDGYICSDRYEPKTIKIISGGKEEIFGAEFRRIS